MTGFLPFWLGASGLAFTAVTAAIVIGASTRLPLWLLPLAAVLAVGTLR